MTLNSCNSTNFALYTYRTTIFFALPSTTLLYAHYFWLIHSKLLVKAQYECNLLDIASVLWLEIRIIETNVLVASWGFFGSIELRHYQGHLASLSAAHSYWF